MSAGCRAVLRLPYLTITPDGRLAIDLRRPTLHALVFGCGVVGLTRLLLARFSDQSPTAVVPAYLAAIPLAFALGKLTSSRMNERASRLYSSSLSAGALGLTALPGALPAGPTGASTAMALVTVLAIATGSALVELLYRAGSRDTPATSRRTGATNSRHTRPANSAARRPRLAESAVSTTSSPKPADRHRTRRT
jgi:hypothetical protein